MNNWYKNIVSSKNVRLSIVDDLKKDSMDAAEYISLVMWDDFLKSQSSKSNGIPIGFINPYNNLKQMVYIVISRYDKNFSNAISLINNDRIYVYPEHMINLGLANSVKSSKGVDVLSSYIFHELIHFLDPKNIFDGFDLKRKRKDINIKNEMNDTGISPEYCIFQPEFDAFCRQICFDIEKSLKNNPQNIDIILKWLKALNLFPLPNCIGNYLNLIKNWQNSSNKKKNYIQLLKQRIYNDLIERGILK